MVKTKGTEVDVKIATSEQGLANAPVIPYISSVAYDDEQTVELTPKGLGSRLQEAKEGLIAYTGSIERDYDVTAVSGTDTFAKTVGSGTTGALTPLYIEVHYKLTGEKVILKKVKGKYNRGVPDVDGIVAETYDFVFEEIAYA